MSPRRVQSGGDKRHHFWDQTPPLLGLCTATGSAPSEMPGTFRTGAGWGGGELGRSPPQWAHSCWPQVFLRGGGDTDEGIARFLSVCIFFSSAFIKHPVILQRSASRLSFPPAPPGASNRTPNKNPAQRTPPPTTVSSFGVSVPSLAFVEEAFVPI